MGFLKKIFRKKKVTEEKNIDTDVKEIETLNDTVEVVKESPVEPLVDEIVEEVVEEETPKIVASLKEKMTKTRTGLFGRVKSFFTKQSIINEDMYEELEDILIQSDIGMDTTLDVISRLEKEVKAQKITEPADIYVILKDILASILVQDGNELTVKDGRVNVVLVVGVNGVGKTTTIGKVASKLIKEGKSVIIGAADTFRAAAVEQLEEWGERSGATVIKNTEGTDPGAVVYKTLDIAKSKGVDVAIIDTAGRLHNKHNLMKELEKINNIIKKQLGHDDYESILVIDGTTGQNGLNQAKVFNETTDLTGIVVTKLDGTAKGGIIFPISQVLEKPVKFIGVGEGIEDLRKFDAAEYIEAIFE